MEKEEKNSNKKSAQKELSKKIVLIFLACLIIIGVLCIVLNKKNKNVTNNINYYDNKIHFKVEQLELMVGDIVNMDDILYIPSNINKDDVKIDNRNSHLLKIENNKMTAIGNGNFNLYALYDNYEISLKIMILEKKTYDINDLYFENFSSYLNNYQKTNVSYNDSGYYISDGEITIENDAVYLKYKKDNIEQKKKINIGDEKPKSVMALFVNTMRYVYILTESGNVYLNDNSSKTDIETFLNFSKVNNLSNVSEMLYPSPYFVINNQIYNQYGEIAKHDVLIKSDDVDVSMAEGNNYFLQVGDDGELYKKIVKKEFMIGSPESASSILNHKKYENVLYKDSNNENVIVSILFKIDDNMYLIDKKGTYYKLEFKNNEDVELKKTSTKKVSSIDKYICSGIVVKIDIHYSDNSKDSYLIETNKLS